MLVSLWLSLLSPTAFASSDIEFKTAGPVLIYVDGEQAELTNKLKQRHSQLDPGVHEIKVTGVFGKTLYEGEIELPDNTITQAEWVDGELKVLSTDWLQESSGDDTGGEDEVDSEEVAEEGVDDEEGEEPIEDAEAAEEPEEPEEPEEEVPQDDGPAVPPIPVAPPKPAPAPKAKPAEVPLAIPIAQEATALPNIAPSNAKTLTVQAHEGMRVEVVHDGQTVVVVVEGGAFRIEDPSGLRMSLSAQR